MVDLTFKPAANCTLKGVSEAGEGPVYLDASNHAQFGPVDHSPVFVATFLPPMPTGSFVLSSTNAPTAPKIGDLSGVYSGTTKTKTPRTYDITVAEDDAGKLAAMGAVSGVQQKLKGSLSSTLDGNVGQSPRWPACPRCNCTAG